MGASGTPCATLSSELQALPEGVVRERVTKSYERLKPGPGKSQESVAFHQRARIHRAVVELATDAGRCGITVRSVTRLAGVSTATFYALFDGVDDCLLSASGSVVDEVRERILAQRSLRAPRSTQCEKVVRALFEGLTADSRAGRLALIEAFGGGPAALGLITSQETSLERALCASLGRRGERGSTTIVSWIANGALHAARRELLERKAPSGRGTSKHLLDWAASCLADPDAELESGRDIVGSRPEWGHFQESQDECRGEAATLRSAVQKLALRDGYWGLSESRISKVAGVPATHFKQHFRDLDDAYLTGVDHLARWLFEPLAVESESEDWTGSVCRQVNSVIDRVGSNENAARLALSQILAPGIRGVTRKEALIDDLAVSWNSSLPEMGRVAGDRTKTAVAGLWATLARAAEKGDAKVLRRAASTYAYLVLVPTVGPRAASIAARKAFSQQAQPGESLAVNASVPN